MNGAGPAQRHTATELRACHAQHVAKHPQKRHARWDIDLVPIPVDHERDHRQTLQVIRRGAAAAATHVIPSVAQASSA